MGPDGGAALPARLCHAFLERLRAEKVFDNLGKTLAEPHIDESAKVVDVTLTFNGAGKPADPGAARRGP